MTSELHTNDYFIYYFMLLLVWWCSHNVIVTLFISNSQKGCQSKVSILFFNVHHIPVVDPQ